MCFYQSEIFQVNEPAIWLLKDTEFNHILVERGRTIIPRFNSTQYGDELEKFRRPLTQLLCMFLLVTVSVSMKK